MQNDSVTIEWAPFRARPGVSDDDIRAAAAAIQGEFLAKQPGFLRRELLRAADGGYVDLLWWKDLASAEAAMAKVGDSPACARYFALMAHDPADPTAVQHLARIASY